VHAAGHRLPAGAFTALALNYLVDWITKGKTPPHAPPIAVDQNTANDGSALALDEYGNAKGGIRNIWVDVPTATNGVFAKGKTDAQDRLCQLAGTKVPLADATLKKLYPATSDYKKKAEQRLSELLGQGGSCRSTRIWSAATSSRHDYRERDGPYVRA
jgi:hypothetical protein